LQPPTGMRAPDSFQRLLIPAADHQPSTLGEVAALPSIVFLSTARRNQRSVPRPLLLHCAACYTFDFSLRRLRRRALGVWPKHPRRGERRRPVRGWIRAKTRSTGSANSMGTEGLLCTIASSGARQLPGRDPVTNQPRNPPVHLEPVSPWTKRPRFPLTQPRTGHAWSCSHAEADPPRPRRRRSGLCPNRKPYCPKRHTI